MVMKVKIFGSLAVFTVVLATPLVASATVNPSVTLSYNSLGAFSDHSAAIAKTVADQDASSLLTEHLPDGKQAYGKFFKLADGSNFTAAAAYAKPKIEIGAGKPGRLVLQPLELQRVRQREWPALLDAGATFLHIDFAAPQQHGFGRLRC